MIAIAEVRHWLKSGGVHCILLSVQPGSILRFFTACGSAGNVGEAVESDQVPARVCRKCRAKLGS